MKLGWIDVSALSGDARTSVVDAALHARLDAIASTDKDFLAGLPPTVRRVAMPGASSAEAEAPSIDGLIEVAEITDEAQLSGVTAALVNVHDDASLQLACAAAVRLDYTIVRYADPTKIPLEIVLAAADGAKGTLVTAVADVEEAVIVGDVLERGSDAVFFAPTVADEVFALDQALRENSPSLELLKLTVTGIEHKGLGDRVCVDTCTHFEPDEGILVGSFSSGFLLCCSETHPLPYMPTRPFRVNAGALHSYVLGQGNRTNYLSELRAGSTVLGVRADGKTRRLVVGRAKLESRPLLSISATAPDGTEVNLIVQDDWHVRVLGPGGVVHNVTELTAGTELLGYVATQQRHVGHPIGEFCVEQ